MPTPILIELHPSRRLAALQVAAHCLSLCAIAVLEIDAAWRLLLSAAVLASAWQVWQAWRSAGVMRLRLGRNGHCEIEKAGAGGAATLLDHTIVVGSLMVLTLSGEFGKRTLVLLPDSSDAESLRRLRVWLRASA